VGILFCLSQETALQSPAEPSGVGAVVAALERAAQLGCRASDFGAGTRQAAQNAASADVEAVEVLKAMASESEPLPFPSNSAPPPAQDSLPHPRKRRMSLSVCQKIYLTSARWPASAWRAL